MSDATLNAVTQDPDDFAVQIADQIESFIVAVTEVAKGDEPDRPSLSCSWRSPSCCWRAAGSARTRTSSRTSATSRTSARSRTSDDLRERLAVLLEPIDVYSEVFDPYEPRKAPVACRISDDLADVVTDLRHGLAHYRAGRTTEALWWWQFSYFSNWGSTASATLRALQSLVAHVRLNQPLEELDGLDTDQDVGRGGPGRGGGPGHGGGDRGTAGPAPGEVAARPHRAAGPACGVGHIQEWIPVRRAAARYEQFGTARRDHVVSGTSHDVISTGRFRAAR